ncbi:MAG: tetraacyldisaccharide 4'-kinase [Parvibaculales bacterium]
MKSPHFWSCEPGAFSLALSPLAAIYSVVGKLRHNFATPSHCGRPVICIGNINLGGTGKTPVTLMIAELLTGAEHRPAVLSRGYGGSQKGPLHVLPDRHSAMEVGDEPLMMSAHVPVIVGADRHRSARLAIHDQHICADILLMDDGLQNPALARAYNLAVIDAEVGFGNGRVFPAGPLREPPEYALRRLDGIMLVHAENADRADLRPDIQAFVGMCRRQDLDVFDCHMQPESALTPPQAERVVSYCGIGRPQKFFDTIDSLGFVHVHAATFADHHHFTERDAEHLLALAATHDAKLITTRKDITRLQNAPSNSLAAKLCAASHVVDITCRLAQPDAFRKALEAAISEDMMSRLYTNL